MNDGIGGGIHDACRILAQRPDVRIVEGLASHTAICSVPSCSLNGRLDAPKLESVWLSSCINLETRFK